MRGSSLRPRRVVYVSYDGMEDPLGKSQVLPYLRGLADRGHRFELISFEKPPAATRVREQLHPGVRWTALRYHKTPTVPATAFDMLQGLGAAALTGAIARADLVHVRSYVAATMVLPLVTAARKPLLFDMRGLWPDERVEDGTWSKTGRIYRGAKAMERLLVSRATAITVLTNSMQRWLREEAPFASELRAAIQVIPTCTDLSRFRPDVAPDAELARILAGHRVLAYVGSFGGRYLSEEMARFYLAWRAAAGTSTRLLVVSRQAPEVMARVLSAAGAGEELVHRSATHTQVPSFARCAEAGVFFHPPTFPNRGAAPTKAGELLALGLPLAGNLVGDVPQVLAEPGAGVVLERFDDEALAAAARRLLALAAAPDAAAKARGVAERWFSLEAGLEAYDALYAALDRPAGPAGDRGWPRR